MSTNQTSQDAPYRLIYWPTQPGRGEHIRLAFEEAGVPYEDTAQIVGGVQEVLAQISDDNVGDAANPPPLAPPILQHGRLVISQTPNILLYLGPRLGLAPRPDGDDPEGLYRVHALALTALDGLSNEVHDCHHPICTSLYYEDQKPESLRRSRAFVTTRLPKYLGYFERVLQGPASGPGTPWLYGGRLTYADLVLFQCLDGTSFMFARAVAQARQSGQYARVFAHYDAVRARPNLAAYLASPRRQAYGNSIYRHYPELDVLPGKAWRERC